MPRRRYERLQEWEYEAIAQAYLAGEKLLAIAAEFDTTESAVSRIAERHGLPRRPVSFKGRNNAARPCYSTSPPD